MRVNRIYFRVHCFHNFKKYYNNTSGRDDNWEMLVSKQETVDSTWHKFTDVVVSIATVVVGTIVIGVISVVILVGSVFTVGTGCVEYTILLPYKDSGSILSFSSRDVIVG